MQRVAIQTNNTHTIRVLQALLAELDPSAIITYEDEPRHLSKKDEIRLQKTYDNIKNGKMKFHNKADIIESTNKTLRKLGANV